VGGSLLGIVFLSLLQWSIVEFFIAVASLNILVVGIIFLLVPEFTTQFIVWIKNRRKSPSTL
jgi:hypothetical protein